MREKDESIYDNFRASVDLGMGLIYIIISVYASLTPYIIEAYGSTTVYTIATLFALYGLFRMYRGFLKMQQFFKSSRTNRHSRKK